MSFFSVQDLSAGYGSRQILQNVSFQTEENQLVGIIGANGSGKTTLLKAVCGILPHQGRCLLEGTALESLSPRQLARRCSYIPQRSGISIDLSVVDVVLMGFNPWLGLLESPADDMKTKARAALAAVGLAGREEDNYLHLSEGQKQLCLFARTLASGGNLLLLDEPESALDFRYRYQMLALLEAWTREKGRGALVTLHDASLALNCCDRLVVLAGGRVRAVLTPRADPLDVMEVHLSAVYGQVSLHWCTTRSGKPQLVMLKEPEREGEPV